MHRQSRTPVKDACAKVSKAYRTLALETTKRKHDALCAIWKRRVDLGMCFLEDFCEDFGVHREGAGSLDARAAKGIPQELEILLERLDKIQKGVQQCHTLISEYSKQREDLEIRALEKVTLISRQFRATQKLYVGICPIEYSLGDNLARRYTAFLEQVDEDFLATLDILPESPPVSGRVRSLWPFGRR
ncbi:hypothetical protein BJY00DRAFT_308107 [Aspergillus carlsbadensis]|nr:hypothetical protein BJY00DRAFT_308107 [Aspergillus carlsbadensis]